jgi:hypothetical protein
LLFAREVTMMPLLNRRSGCCCPKLETKIVLKCFVAAITMQDWMWRLKTVCDDSCLNVSFEEVLWQFVTEYDDWLCDDWMMWWLAGSKGPNTKDAL